jgi:hypothetical protein
MNPLEIVIPIVAIVMLTTVLKTWIKYRATGHAGPDPEAAMLRDEVKKLRDRVAVLERIATDKENLLEQEIERLRDS